MTRITRMKHRYLGYAMALVMVVGTGTLPAQAQILPPTPTTPPSPEVTPQGQPMERVTVTGCLKQERDVPGLTPNLAERAGLGEDFVLTNAKLTAISAPTSDTSPSQARDPETQRAASATMYRITGIDKDKLQALMNQRVEVTGRLETPPVLTSAGPQTLPGAHAETEVETQVGRAEHLPQIRASAIRSIAGSCTAGTE